MSSVRWVQPRPCAKCPFLQRFVGDADYLRPGRRSEIINGLLHGASFPCHETVLHDSDGEPVAGGVNVECAGAALVLLRAGRDSQLIRIAERMGAFDEDEFLARNEDVRVWPFKEAQRG